MINIYYLKMSGKCIRWVVGAQVSPEAAFRTGAVAGYSAKSGESEEAPLSLLSHVAGKYTVNVNGRHQSLPTQNFPEAAAHPQAMTPGFLTVNLQESTRRIHCLIWPSLGSHIPLLLPRSLLKENH